MTDREIWREARRLIEVHCDDAVVVCGVLADASLEEGDFVAQRMWLRVLATIKEIRSVAIPGTWLN